MSDITVRYSSVDRFSERRSFKTLEGARRFAHKWVGATPEMGSRYAVSSDGVGKITCEGCTLADLFPTPLTLEQTAALREFAQMHGRGWKAKLHADWAAGRSQGALQHLRNTHGPSWLVTFRLDTF